MDKITIDLKKKRVHSIGISQAVNVRKLIEDYINENFQGQVNVCKMYVGYDNDYFKTLGFDIRFTDVFKGELVSPINLRYMLKGEIPSCDILFVLIDTVVDRDLTDDILANIPLTTHLVYLYDNLLTDFSDGEFYKRFIKCDSDIQTYTRRTDVVPAINMILNKLKKCQVKYLVDPIFMSQDFIVTHEAIKDEEILDYDKIILINGENIGEYNIRIREALSRPFSPVTRDKMICYTPVVAKVLHPDYSVTTYDIPIYSDLVIVDKVQDSDMFNAPIYRVKYTLPSGEDIEFEIPINLNFIDLLNEGAVSKDVEFTPDTGYKLYFSYAIPLYAAQKRYNKILLIAGDDSIINKSVIYTAIRYAKNTFKLIHGNNVFLE